MRDEPDDTSVIIGEAVRTIFRRKGDTQAYKQVKELTRGRKVTPDDLHDLLAGLDVDEEIREKLLTPTSVMHVGLADELVDDIEN